MVVILGALVALRLRRRQRYRPRAPWPGRDLRPPALTPGLTELLAARRAHADEAEELGFESPPERPPLSTVPEVGVAATPDRIEVAMSDNGTAPSIVELSLGEWPGLVLSVRERSRPCARGAGAARARWPLQRRVRDDDPMRGASVRRARRWSGNGRCARR